MKISIPQPCHENWNDMLPAEKGRFCQSCQKCVYDFSNLSNEEIIKTINKPNVCIKATQTQLDNLSKNQIFNYSKWFKYSGFIVFFGLSNITFSQEIELQTNKDSIRIIYGKIIDKENNPVSDAMVGLKGHRNLRVVADSLGQFQIEIPNNISSNEFFVESEYGLYDYILEENKENIIQMNNYLITKEAMIVGQVYIKKSFGERLLYTITWPFRQIGKIF